MKKTLFTTRRLTLLYKGLTILPLIMLVLFVALPLEFRVMFGHWPRMYWDDIDMPFFRYQTILAIFSSLVSFVTVIPWIVLTIFIWAKRLMSTRSVWTHVAVVVCSWVSLVVGARLLPIMWWFD